MPDPYDDFEPELREALLEHRKLLAQDRPSSDPKCIAAQAAIEKILGPMPKLGPSEQHLLAPFLKKVQTAPR